MISNEKVLHEREAYLYDSIVKQKMSFAGHVLRGSSGDSAV